MFDDRAMKASRNQLLFRITNIVGWVALVLGAAALASRLIERWNGFTFYLTLGSVVLSFLWAIPHSFSFAGPLDDPELKRCNKSRGEIDVPSQVLLVSDQWDLRGAKEFTMLQPRLAVSAVIRNRLVRSVHLGEKPLHMRDLTDVAEIPVDTGHLIFADRDLLQHIDSKTIGERIMLVLSSHEPLTLFLMDSAGRPLGFAVGTGHGDGRYNLLVDDPERTKFVLCRFS